MTAAAKPKLLSSGNPQIPKGDGDEAVQAYIAAMPGWKRDIGRRLNKIVERVYPEASRAVRWNTPLYGKDDGWFFSMYCYKRYVQLTFMRGTSLSPVPPGSSKTEGTRYFNIHETDKLNEALIESWVEQACRLPGVKL